MIKKISTKDTYLIRKEILRKNIDLPYKLQGDVDMDTFHLGAFKNEKIVGVVSFMKPQKSTFKEPQYQLRGMATALEVRGEGYGGKLVDKGFEILKKQNVEIVWCNARVKAVEFYQKKGFKIIGESFDIEKVGKHYKMFKNLI